MRRLILPWLYIGTDSMNTGACALSTIGFVLFSLGIVVSFPSCLVCLPVIPTSAAMFPDEQPAYTFATLTGASARQSGCRTRRTFFPVGLPHRASILTDTSLSTNHPAALSINQGCVVRGCATIRASGDRLRSRIYIRHCSLSGRSDIRVSVPEVHMDASIRSRCRGLSQPWLSNMFTFRTSVYHWHLTR